MKSGLWSENGAIGNLARRNSGELLHHFCCPPCLRRQLARTPDPISYQVKSVHGGAIRFSLAEACKENGLLTGDEATPAAARKAWGCSQGLLDCLRRSGISMESIDRIAGSLDAVIVGWEDVPNQEKTSLCKDVALTVAVLSRTVGGIFFADREPDYSLDNLLARQLVIDERLPGRGTDRKGSSK